MTARYRPKVDQVGLDEPQMRYLFETFNLASIAGFLDVTPQHASNLRKEFGFPRAPVGSPSRIRRAINGAAPASRYFG